MHYLIDGHNLIAQLSDISLDEPNDEAKLVLRLRSWIASGRKREVTIVFDGGLPGGTWRYMSRGKIKALFATEGQTADALLVGRINQVKNPSAYTLVTSDREILAVAKKRKMPYMTSQAFAQQLQKNDVPLDTNTSPDLPAEEKPVLNDDELDEWLAIFGMAQEPLNANELEVNDPLLTEGNRSVSVDPSEPVVPHREPTILKSGSRKLSSDEVDEWLALFQNSDEDQAKGTPKPDDS